MRFKEHKSKQTLCSLCFGDKKTIAMRKRKATVDQYVQPYRYPSPNIPMSAIKRFARRIADKFHPDKIILFGSYAYGTPHNESDVDLLVIMPCRDAIDQSIRITSAFERYFAFDLIVRTPAQIKRGLKEGDCDWFLHEIIKRGKVLYEAPHRPMGAESRGRHGGRPKSGGHEETAQGRRLLSLPAGG
jgi:predicted nucleotidyltransferase